MWAAIKGFFSSNVSAIMEWAGIGTAIAASLAAIFEAGKKSEKSDEIISIMKDEVKANAIEDQDKATLHNGDAANELRDSWS